MERFKSQHSYVHTLRSLRFALATAVAFLFSAATHALPVTFDPQDYEGGYAIRNVTNFRSGPSTIDLAPGNYQLSIGNGTVVPISIAPSGFVTTTNNVAITTGNATVAINTVPVVIDPRDYGLNTGGRWEIQFIHSANATSSPGPQSVNLAPNVSDYRMIIGNSFGFTFSLDASGNVTSSNPASATGGFRTLDLNTLPVVIDPSDYGQNQFARWDVQFTYSATATSRPGQQTVQLVPGVADYKMIIGDRLGFLFSVDDLGNVSVANPASALGGLQSLTFNAMPVSIDPGDLSENSAGDWGVRFINQVRSANDPGPKTVWLVPGVSEYGMVVGDVSPGFRFAVDNTGNVSVPNPALATGGLQSLTLNTEEIDVDPNGYAGDWSVRFLHQSSGVDTVRLVPGINGYQLGGGQTNRGSFNVLADGTPSPSTVPITHASGVFDFLLTKNLGLPLASAGPDQSIDEGMLVTLDGTGSTDPQNDQLTYAWSQLAGPTITLSDGQNARPTFTAPPVSANETVTLQLIVSDGSSASDPDTVDIIIKNANNSPVADAGDDATIKAGATTILNGSGSFDPDGDAISYQWQQIAGTTVALSDPAAQNPSFDAPLTAGLDLTFKLVVNDGFESSSSSPGSDSAEADTVKVTVVTNSEPVADAGPDQARGENTLVSLNGSASADPDGDNLTYVWTQLNGPTITLSDHTIESPIFTAPFVSSGGDQIVLQLKVTDDDSLDPKSATDIVTISLVNVNDPPSCDLAEASKPILWPPNHKFKHVSIVGVEDPETGNSGVTISISGVRQDEPVSGTGDGDTAPDAIIQSNASGMDDVLVRAERQGSADGRVYEIRFNASDGDEFCEGSINVGVPKKRKDTPIDGGPWHNSLDTQ